MKKHLKKDNRGFTLVELIVTLLIMSIVMVAAAGFLATAINSYRVSNIEIKLQNEAQIAMNQLNDILIETQEYDFQEAAQRLTVHTKERTYRFFRDASTKNLMYCTAGRSISLYEEDSAFGSPAMLAKNLDQIHIEKVNKLMQIELTFEYADRTYKTTSCISLRNE